MKLLKAAALAACITGMGAVAPASAAVLYEFSATGLNFQVLDFTDPDNPTVISTTPYNVTFTLSRSSYITAEGLYATTSCSTSEPSLVLCKANQEFAPAKFGFETDFLSFQYDNADMSGGGGAFFFFEDGAFTNNGTYSTVDPGPGFGNAGVGTLTVSGFPEIAVPEPMSLALLGGGLLGLGLLRRRG